MLRWCEGILLFLFTVKCLRVFRFNQQFARLGDVYRKARREILTFFVSLHFTNHRNSMIIIVSSLEIRLSIFPVPASVPDELILMRL